MLTRPILIAALATATLVGMPATSAAATTASLTPNLITGPSVRVVQSTNNQGPGPVFDGQDGPVGGDADVFPIDYPVAVLHARSLVPLGSMIEFVLDDSTGDIVAQELRVEGPDPLVWFTFGCQGPPSADCWLQLWLTVTGRYTATLTVTSSAGYTDTVTHGFFVAQAFPSPVWP